jgi:Uma2 family endonuclease
MGTRTADYLEAIGHLPAGATLTLHSVEWDEYEQLLSDLVERPGLRVAYDEGTLEIVSTSAQHEKHKDLILQLVRVLAEASGFTLESVGSTTWKRPALRKGAEPDTCFYVANALQIIGKAGIDLEVDPPPDIVEQLNRGSRRCTSATLVREQP